MKHVPGRKTDLADSQWLAGLLRLRGIFISPQQVRQWRELTRLREAHQESLADFPRLIHKLSAKGDKRIGIKSLETGRPKRLEKAKARGPAPGL